MRFKLDAFSRKRKKTKYLAGIYTLSKKNNNNKKITSKLLTIFAGISIFLFIFLMMGVVYLIGALGYTKLTEDTSLDKVSSVAIIVPSLQKNSLAEFEEEVELLANNQINVEDINKRYFFFFPITLFIPIILIITFIHEFGHYIMCRRAGVNVKEYGIGCISLFCIPTPLIFAYVEPAKTHMDKTSKFNYFSIVSAGCVMNFFLTIVLFFTLFVFYTQFFYYLFLLNTGVMLVNALPIAILDGGLMVGKINKKIGYGASIISILGLVILL